MHERVPADERRRRLIDAAFRVIARGGVAAATTRAVTAEAGMPLASLHHVFLSRDDLLAALITDATARAASAARAAMLPAGDGAASLDDVVLDAFRSYLAAVRSAPERELAMFELTQFALRTPGLEHLAAEQYRSYRATVAAVYAELEAQFGMGWDTHRDELAAFTVVLTDGIVLAWLVDRDDEAADRSIELAAGAVVARIRASAGRRAGTGVRS